MADGPTTGAEGLLERAEQLEALAGHLAAVDAQGRGRLVLVAGEAGNVGTRSQAGTEAARLGIVER